MQIAKKEADSFFEEATPNVPLPALRPPDAHRDVPSPSELSDVDEADLAARAKSDPEAFGRLFEAYYPRVLNFAYRCTQNIAVAEDLTSNTFLQALRAIGRYDRRASFLAWLFRIALNEVRMHWRTMARRRRREADWPHELNLDRVYFEVSELETEEDVREKLAAFERLRRGVNMLPDRYRGAVILRYYEELPYETIADVLGRRVGTVKSLVHRGIKRLEEILEHAATLHGPRH